MANNVLPNNIATTDKQDELLVELQGQQKDALTDAELRAVPVAVENLTQLVPEQYDDIELGYTGLDLTTVTYRSGGGVVATLTLTYTLGQLTRVVRS